LDIEQKAYKIDQVVSMDLVSRKVSPQLYNSALKAVGSPLCFAAAEKIVKATDQTDAVFILTGFPIPPLNIPETDGPPGATVLAQTLKGIGLRPILVADDLCSGVINSTSHLGKVLKVPVESEQASSQAQQLLKDYNPAVLLSIERPGWNVKHEYHNMRGLNISGIVGKTDYLFELGRKAGVLTISVGDGGNELGCGSILETVRKHIPNGSLCRCPCQSGIAAATPADVLVVSGVSNWGAYGIAACLSLLKAGEYGHDHKLELHLLNRCVKAGAIDSISLEPKPFVDGLPPELNGLVVDLICAITNA
jgi:hypothetical protein